VDITAVVELSETPAVTAAVAVDETTLQATVNPSPGGGGSGDVVGPASATDGRAALFDGPTGKLLKVASAAPVLEGDARLSDARTPTAHAASHGSGGSDAITVAQGQVTGLGTALAGKETAGAVAAHEAAADPHPGYLTAAEGNAAYATAAQGALATTAVQPGNTALSDSREWSATTINQAEAEAGTSTTRRAFTAQRVFQSIAAWWAASAAKTKLDGIATGAEVNVNADWNATSGDAQILNKPALPTGTNTGDQTLSNTSNATSHTVTLSASGGSVQLVEGSNITLTTTGTSGAAVVTIASTVSGGGGDWDTLIETEISVTGTATATLGRMHVCSGTAANYTVTLPTAVGNSGKVIGFRMSSALTRFVTIDGNASENIDGALTRILWANEVAILRSDGSNWHKIAGKSIPMIARISRWSTDGAQDISGATVTTVLLVRSVSDNTTRMQNLANNAIICRRPGVYAASGTLTWGPLPNALASNVQGRVTINGTFAEYLGPVISAAVTSSFPANVGNVFITLAAEDSVTLRAYQNQSSGNATYPLYLEANDGTCNFGLTEYITW